MGLGGGEECVGVEFVALGKVLCDASARLAGQPGLWGGHQGRELVCTLGAEGDVKALCCAAAGGTPKQRTAPARVSDSFSPRPCSCRRQRRSAC